MEGFPGVDVAVVAAVARKNRKDDGGDAELEYTGNTAKRCVDTAGHTTKTKTKKTQLK